MNQSRQKTASPQRKPVSQTTQIRLAKSKANEFIIQKLFNYGYRNKEDVSNLPANTLVVGSQNVLTNAAEIVGLRQGYILDGSAGNQNTYGIDSSYDFLTRQSSYRNLRKWGTTLEIRYVNPSTSAVTWQSLALMLLTNVVNFTAFWDFNTELKMLCLFVNGDNNIYEWSGGVGSFASATANSITLSGTLTTSQLNFYDNASNSAKFILLDKNGNQYTYTGVSAQTFNGVTPSPLAGFAVGDPVIQKVATINGTNITTNGSGNLGSSFLFSLISTLENQVWYGSLVNNTVYVSKTNVYTDVSFSTPARLPAEGALITLDAAPVGFAPEAQNMYITAGRDEWWISEKNQQTVVVADVAIPTETLYAVRLKTAFNQAAQSQGLIGQYKNSLIYVSNEQIINALGMVKDIYSQPQVTNMSDPIKYDIDAYDFTGGQVIYDNYFIYVSVPRQGVVRMYNVVKQYWEAPQTIPVSSFYHVSSAIYGHSSLTNESYELFIGYNDNGNPIPGVAAFPYVSVIGGSPFQKKSFMKVYTEGYIAANTKLTLGINYDFGGSTGTYSVDISGTDPKIIFNKITDGSLGRNPLGTQPIGTILNLPNQPAIPKFRIINTMPSVDVYEYQIVYSSNEVDYNWQLLRFGPASSHSSNEPFEISE